MPNHILDALERSLGETVDTIGSVLSAPGDYYRGAMAGSPDVRMTGREYLEGPGGMGGDDPYGGLKGFAYGVATDPLLLADAAVKGASSVAREFGAGGGLNPISRAISEFGADQSGYLDWNVFGRGLRTPARQLLKEVGPEDYFARKGLDFAELPARKLEVLGERVGIPVEWSNPGQEGGLATYRPWTGSVALPPHRKWVDPSAMAAEMESMGTGVPPWLSTTDPRHLGVHELVHGLHHRATGSEIEHIRGAGGVINPEISGWLGRNVSNLATKNPNEAVAEVGSKMVLTPGSIIKPKVQQFYQERGGPDLDELARALGVRIGR